MLETLKEFNSREIDDFAKRLVSIAISPAPLIQTHTRII
jgi:hypothetical protein